MKILVIKPSSLGDIIHTFPAVDALRNKFPNAEIYWLVNDSLAGIVELTPSIDETILFHRQQLGKVKNIRKIFSFLQELKSRNFDIVFDFQGLFRSAFFAKMTGAPEIIGFKNAREFAPLFYTKKIELPPNISHAIDKNNYLVQSYIGDQNINFSFPKLRQFDDCVNAANRLLAQFPNINGKKLIAIAPESRWPSKTWPPEFFAQVIDQIASQTDEFAFWLLGTKDEAKTGSIINELCKVAKPLNFMGSTNLGTMVELLNRSCAMLTNDSGPMHIGAALQIPIFALFGPTDPQLTGPYGNNATVFKGDIGCGNCRKRICNLPQGSRCHEAINSSTVANSMIEKLKLNNERSSTHE
ncbi:MAG: lipopolysaccharide heptosyltransferase II [Lentisphaeria bacterium]